MCSYFRRFVLVTAFLAVSLSAAFAQVDPNFHIYLCFGQSNMEGNASPENIDRQNIPARFKMMAAVNFNNPSRKMYNWYEAKPPLVREGTGLTPVDWFGRTMCDNLPEEVKIGVVVVAIGGCKIEDLDKDFDPVTRLANEADWFKNYMKAYDNYPYKRLLACAKEAQKVGVIKGMLLHQGCSNNGDQLWPTKVKKLYNDLLTDLNLKAEDVPLLAGELATQEMGGSCWWHNTIIQTLPKTIPTAHVISAANLPQKGDGLHFSAHGYRVLGCRYATKMLHLLGVAHPTVAYVEEQPIDLHPVPTEWDHQLDFNYFKGAIHGDGLFNNKRGVNIFMPGADCCGGWEWLDTPLDLSAYKYLVAEIEEKQTLGLKMQVWDTANYDDTPYVRDFGSNTVVVAELDGMMKNLSTGIEGLNTSHIYRIGFYANGDKTVKIRFKHVFATNNDPYDPDAPLALKAITNVPTSANDAIYNLQGIKLSRMPDKGLVIKDGKKYCVK
ncbi:MAG: hypothetical protein HUK06_06940 [Bacteroidaceae bacterium]|nr:hypothetical protein [Bacteroidaceae bacterium]